VFLAGFYPFSSAAPLQIPPLMGESLLEAIERATVEEIRAFFVEMVVEQSALWMDKIGLGKSKKKDEGK
jgi:hypothetical protein